MESVEGVLPRHEPQNFAGVTVCAGRRFSIAWSVSMSVLASANPPRKPRAREKMESVRRMPTHLGLDFKLGEPSCWAPRSPRRPWGPASG